MTSDFQLPSYIFSEINLSSLIKLGQTTESIVLDFKARLTTDGVSKRDKEKLFEELALDICQFANTWGGVILVGINEEVCPRSGKKVASSYVDTDNYEDISKLINDSVLPLLHPKEISVDVIHLRVQQKCNVIAINVRPICTGVCCVYKNQPPYTSKYPYRTHYGKKYLTPSDVEKRMSSSNRHIPIKLVELSSITKEVKLFPNVTKEDIDSETKWDYKGIRVYLKGVSSNEYTLSVCGVELNIPFSLTEDIWITEDNEIGIFLKVNISISSDRKSAKINLK